MACWLVPWFRSLSLPYSHFPPPNPISQNITSLPCHISWNGPNIPDRLGVTNWSSVPHAPYLKSVNLTLLPNKSLLCFLFLNYVWIKFKFHQKVFCRQAYSVPMHHLSLGSPLPDTIFPCRLTRTLFATAACRASRRPWWRSTRRRGRCPGWPPASTPRPPARPAPPRTPPSAGSSTPGRLQRRDCQAECWTFVWILFQRVRQTIAGLEVIFWSMQLPCRHPLHCTEATSM